MNGGGDITISAKMGAMYAVTGATGQLGGRVATRLAAEGHDLRLVVRDAERAPRLQGVDVEEADYRDFEAMRAALVGADVALLVSASEALDRVEHHRTAIDAAAAAGVVRIVYTSFLAAAQDATFTFARDHWATEQYVRALGLSFTFLRSSLFADLVPSWASPEGVIAGPGGAGRVAWVARDDIADVAVAVLTGTGHDGRSYDVTGGEALSLPETAQVLAAAAGREVTFEEQSMDDARSSRLAAGAEDWAVEGWITSYAAIGAGDLDLVSSVVGDLTGHAAMTLGEYLSKHPESLEHLR